MQITFTTTGQAHCLYSELIPLPELGKLKVTRASKIEFSHSSQEWEVIIKRKKIFKNKSRSECLKWEEKHLG
jgi:hypothetical protein